jgi:oxaloacetate decarboxylase alpha subunit
MSLHRVSAEVLARSLEGIGQEVSIDVGRLWQACELVDALLGEEPVTPLSPRVAVRAAEHQLPAGLVAELDSNLRMQGFGDRLDAVLEELTAIRAECGWPPLASPIGQVLGSQALIHVLSAQRWTLVVDEIRDMVSGRYGSPPQDVDPLVRRSIQLLGEADAADGAPQALEDIRDEAEGLAASEEELLLLALFGADAEALLRSVRSRGRRDDLQGAALERSESERIRELIRVVQESGIGELTIEEGERRVTVRRTDEVAAAAAPLAAAAAAAAVPASDADVSEVPLPPRPDDVIRVEAPMVGTFYRAPSPEAPPFVQEGDAVAPGQTLCILEAMKLMNEIKADQEALVRTICVENAEAVEYGQLLFELEPLNGRPLDAL